MPMDGSELPERVTRHREGAAEAGSRLPRTQEHPDSALTSVHNPALVEHLSTAYDSWVDGGFVEHGQDRVVPYFFPTAAMLAADRSRRVAASVHARAGAFCYDTMTTARPRQLGGDPSRPPTAP